MDQERIALVADLLTKQLTRTDLEFASQQMVLDPVLRKATRFQGLAAVDFISRKPESDVQIKRTVKQACDYLEALGINAWSERPEGKAPDGEKLAAYFFRTEDNLLIAKSIT